MTYPHSSYERQWHLHGRSRLAEVDPRASVECEAAWRVSGRGSPEVVVAIVDDGCQISHPTFGGLDKFVGGGHLVGDRYHFVAANGRFDALYQSGRTHGTSMAALIGGTGVGGSSGAAPNCRLFPIATPAKNGHLALGSDQLLSMLDLIASYADIAVVSWSRLPLLILAENVLQRWVEVSVRGGRRGKGVLFFIPAGNSNCPIHWKSEVPLPYAVYDVGTKFPATVLRSRTFTNLLAAIPNVAHVAAVSSLAQRSLYSCYGPGIDFCAPSSNSRVFTGSMDSVQGLGLTTSYGERGEVTDCFKGTSGAAALAAGVAALSLSGNMALSASELFRVLACSASKDLNFREPTATLPERLEWEIGPISPFECGGFNANGWSPWFGFGKLDAKASVVHAIQMSIASR